MREDEENMWKPCVQYLSVSLALWPFQARKTTLPSSVRAMKGKEGGQEPGESRMNVEEEEWLIALGSGGGEK